MKKRALPALAAVAALALSACAPPAVEEEAPQGDTSVNIGWNQPFYSYNDDSTNGNAVANAIVLYLMRDSFNYYNPDLQLVANESYGSYEKLSEDPLTVKYTVAEDTTWSDGAPVDAADLLLQWAALSSAFNNVEDDAVERDPESGQPAAGKPGQVYFDGGSEGLALVTQTPEIGDDGRSITLVYDKPFADWEVGFEAGVPAHATAMNALGIDDPQEAKDALVTAIKDKDEAALSKIANFWNTGFDYTSLPEDETLRLSNGAYLMTEFKENQFLTLEKNPDYTGEHEAQIDKVTIRWNEDPLASVQALQNGELDLISPQSTTDVLEAVEAIDGVTVETGEEPTYEHVDLTYDNGGPFDPKTYGGDEEKAKAVRLAFLKTIPRQEILEKLIKPLKPEAELRDSQNIGNAAPGYSEMIEANGSAEFADVDYKGAKKLLADAGVKTPVDVRYLYANDNVRRQDTYELVKQSGAKGGFNVVDGGDVDWGSILGTGIYDASMFGWQSTSTAVTDSDANFSTGGANNFSGFSNERVDELYDELQTTTDDARKLEIQIEVEKILWEDGFGVTLYQFPGITAYNDNIANVQTLNLSPTIFYGFWEWEAGSAG